MSSSNNFLNRRKLNINLFNKGSYTSKNAKKILVHPMLIKQNIILESKYSDTNNLDVLGFYIPLSDYQKQKEVINEIIEYNMIIDNLDRDKNVYKNPLKFKIIMDPLNTDPEPYILRNKLKNIKYIEIKDVSLPLNINLLKKEILLDIDLINYFETNTIIRDNEYDYQESKLQICNYIKKDNENWEINYTINKNKEIVYSTGKKNNIKFHYQYQLNDNSISYGKNIYLNMKGLSNPYILGTNNNYDSILLSPKKIRNENILFNIKRDLIVYKNTNLESLSSVTISFTNEFGKELNILNLDNEVSNDKYCICGDEPKYSCSCYYLRHPYNIKWQCYILLKIGVYKLDIKTNHH